MENSVIIRQFEQLNLNHKEAQVYLALLGLGQTGSSKIIGKTGLHGQYVYQALAKLEERGLVQHVIMRGRRKFSAKHPRALMQLAEEKRRVAKELTKKLETMLVLPKQQETEIYQGQEAFVAHEFELLEQMSAGSELLVIGGEGDQFAKSMGGRLFEYEKERNKNRITVRYIASENQKLSLEEGKRTRQNFTYKILPGLFTGEVNTNIYPEAVGFNIYGTPVTGFVVRNTLVAQSQSIFFETLWKLGK